MKYQISDEMMAEVVNCQRCGIYTPCRLHKAFIAIEKAEVRA